MSNIYDKRWQALRFAVDCIDFVGEDDLADIHYNHSEHRKVLLEMQEDNLLNARNAKHVDAGALDDGLRKRDFIQNFGPMPAQIKLYRLLADGQELVLKAMEGTIMFPHLQQQKLIGQLDDLIRETEEFSGKEFK